MQNFNLMRNALIEKIDQSTEERVLKGNLKNKLKTLVKTGPNPSIGSSSLYSRQFTFDIPRIYDNLAQMYIKCTLSTGRVPSTVETYFATKIFKYMIIRDKISRTEICTITPQYTSARIDELYNTPLFTHLNNSIEPSVEFNAGDPVVFVPVFAFFSEKVQTFLRTRSLSPLEIECIVNDDFESMGMSATLTSAEYELHCLYFDTNDSSRKVDMPLLQNINSGYKLPGSYNVFYEDKVICASGSTRKSLLIRCPHPAFAIHCSLVDSATNRKQINTFELKVGGNTIVKLDYRMNYTLFAQHNSFVENGTFSYFINQENFRSEDSGLLVFNGSMSPAYINITFDALSEDYTLHTFMEYRTDHKVDEKGYIHPSNDDYLPESTGYRILQYPNSSTVIPNLNG